MMNNITTYSQIKNYQNKPKKIVILLHGYGANGKDLLSISENFKDFIPESIFIAPNGPIALDQYNNAFCWFHLENREQEYLYKGLEAAYLKLKAFIDAQLQKHNLTYKELILFGFSQGSMLAIHTAINLPDCINAAISMSGAYIANPNKNALIANDFPLILTHGKKDDIIDHDVCNESYISLKQHLTKIEKQISNNAAHHLDTSNIKAISHFLEKI